jgi:hypothetical protein
METVLVCIKTEEEEEDKKQVLMHLTPEETSCTESGEPARYI